MRSIASTLADWGPAGVFLLAVLDSAGVPLPTGVEALLLLVATSNPAAAYRAGLLSVFGSALGSLFLFYLARKGGELYLDRHTISPRTLRFRLWFQEYGLLTVFIPALVPIPLPLKVFVLSAGALGVQPIRFLLVILAARIPRYLGLAYLGSQLGENSAAWLKDHSWHLAGVALALFAFLFLLIQLARRRKRLAGLG